jgi:hypothetical protein
MSNKVVLNSIDSAAVVTKDKPNKSKAELAESLKKLRKVNEAWHKAVMESFREDRVSLEGIEISVQIFEDRLKWKIRGDWATTTNTSEDASEKQQLGKLEPTGVWVNNIENSVIGVATHPEWNNTTSEFLTPTQHLCEVPSTTSQLPANGVAASGEVCQPILVDLEDKLQVAASVSAQPVNGLCRLVLVQQELELQLQLELEIQHVRVSGMARESVPTVIIYEGAGEEQKVSTVDANVAVVASAIPYELDQSGSTLCTAVSIPTDAVVKKRRRVRRRRRRGQLHRSFDGPIRRGVSVGVPIETETPTDEACCSNNAKEHGAVVRGVETRVRKGSSSTTAVGAGVGCTSSNITCRRSSAARAAGRSSDVKLKEQTFAARSAGSRYADIGPASFKGKCFNCGGSHHQHLCTDLCKKCTWAAPSKCRCNLWRWKRNRMCDEVVSEPVKRGPPAVPLYLPVVRCGIANTSSSVGITVSTTVPTLSSSVSVALALSTSGSSGYSRYPESVVSTQDVQTLHYQELSGSTVCPDVKLGSLVSLEDRGICSS